jgi:hypothetical protein
MRQELPSLLLAIHQFSLSKKFSNSVLCKSSEPAVMMDEEKNKEEA